MVKSQKKPRKKISLSRPPVVSILGHIDHGKTTLLDQIRKTNVASSEAGGITQHIGAYQIDFKGKKITFIDTPGHAAFAKMRARGAEVTDLAILVIAADEGVKPQTRQSLKFIRQAKVPFLVAVNKIDLPSGDVQKTINQLAKEDVLVEKKGGEIVLVPVSAKTGRGIEDLLEMTLLIGEMQGFAGDPGAEFKGVVIESKLDRSRGPLATILVKEGTLLVSDLIWAEGVKGKIKAMYDERGQKVVRVLPSQPASVLGFSSVPPVGAKAVVFRKEMEMVEPPRAATIPKEKEKEIKEGEKKKLKLVLKADTRGTLEALEANLPSEVELIYQGVGDVNEGDVFLAQTTDAYLIGFNVRLSTGVAKLAQFEKVPVQTFKVIYKLLEEIEKKVLRLLEPTIDEEVLGEAEILKEFIVNKKKIAGARVLKGSISRGNRLHLKRDDKILADSRANSLRKGKVDVDKVVDGEEFGVILGPQLDFEPGDMLVSVRKLPQKE